MLFAKKIKQILLLVFLVSTLASCDKVCYEADQFHDEVHTIYANGQDGKGREIFGVYNDSNGGEAIEWQKTGMIASGGDFLIAISGGWTDVDINSDDEEKEISKKNSCRLCFRELQSSETDNCMCGPIFDNAQLETSDKVNWEQPSPEVYKTTGETNAPGVDCEIPQNANNIDSCTCKEPTNEVKSKFFNDNGDVNYFSFSREAYSKKSKLNDFTKLDYNSSKDCAYKMGVGLYIGLIPSVSGDSVPPVAYHLASQEVVCPGDLNGENRCIDSAGRDKATFIYRSPELKIFKKSKPGEANVQYHELGDEVRLNIYDQYLSDNSGKYNVKFMRGVISKEGGGIMADIVRSFDEYLFGFNKYNDKLKINEKKDGVVEFMYKAVLKDPIVRSVISISLALYVSFFGLAFFMGLTDFGKKEIMMRLLKIGLVVLFTSEKAWQMYNDIIVAFFKDGMDVFVGMISGIFESNMDKTLSTVALQAEGNSVAIDAGRKFIHSDNLIKDLISKPTISKIFGLLWVKGSGFNFFALIYIPAILLLIVYFIYMVLDVALKYMINILKICIGLALGPVFILFSLFEKTKDMFKNWVAFIAARSLEIVILFAMLHPFLIILDHSFVAMLLFKVCSAEISAGLWSYNIWETEPTGRSIFGWFQCFLKIGALIFITKSVCDRAGYISGQLISIGGVANSDASERGGGEGGFNMASAIAKGTFGLAKTALTNSKISQAGKFAGRLMIRGLTKAGRSGINNMVNGAFKAVGIRNRGLRSFMRDREIDNAFNLASGEANQLGLEGKDRDKYIRESTGKRLELFENQNKNKASLLGIDKKNIRKRLDQKLIKEPMKNFIKQQGEELKNQGIIGKAARNEIEERVKDWGQQNLNLSDRGVERKVSEFFKKSSVQGVVKSASEMSSSQAINYIGNLISTGDIDRADEFKKRFRENAIEGKMEKYQKREENKREGGMIGRGLVRAGNIFGKVVAQPIAGVKDGKNMILNSITSKADRKVDNRQDAKLNFSKDNLANSLEEKVAGQGVIRAFGRFENKVAKERDRFFGLLGYAGMDEGKDFRKFDRKLARKLSNPEAVKKIEDYNEENKKANKTTAFDSELSAAKNEIIKDRTIFKYGEDDSTLKFIGKLAGNTLVSPYAFVKKKGYMYLGGEREEFRRLARENQLTTLREMAKDETKKINGKLGTRIEQNLKVDEKTGAEKTKAEKDATLNRLEKSGNHRDSMEKVALMMKKMEKTVKDQEKAEVKAFKDKEIIGKGFGARVRSVFYMRNNATEEGLAKDNQKERLEKLQGLNSRNEEVKLEGGEMTVFERLSKIETIKKVSNLKSEFVKEVYEKIENINDKKIDDLEKLEALSKLKGALFKSMDDLIDNPELEAIFRKITNKGLVDIVSGDNTLASPPASNPASPPTGNASDSNFIDAKKGYRKQQQLLKKFYEGEKTIAQVEASDKDEKNINKAKASDKFAKKRLDTIYEEDEEGDDGLV